VHGGVDGGEVRAGAPEGVDGLDEDGALDEALGGGVRGEVDDAEGGL